MPRGYFQLVRRAPHVVDSLAERLLYHHAQRSFSAADARIGILTDPYRDLVGQGGLARALSSIGMESWLGTSCLIFKQKN